MIRRDNFTLSYEKNYYYELMISETKPDHNSEELDKLVEEFVKRSDDLSSYKQYPKQKESQMIYYDKCHMVAFKEYGSKKKKWHYHIFIQRNPLEHNLQTFRSQIKKLFGKSNTQYDWKLRRPRTTVEQMFLYICKGGDLRYYTTRWKPTDDAEYGTIYEEAVKRIGQYERYTQTEKSRNTMKSDIKNRIIRCQECIDWERAICKRDIAKAIIAHYKEAGKWYDRYHIRKMITTFYYQQDEEHEERFIDELVDGI